MRLYSTANKQSLHCSRELLKITNLFLLTTENTENTEEIFNWSQNVI
ncbi:MAG: hypothetical protein LBP59_18430 [Planctomycetaceae bacterium]|nr:hypothetical protein [Planctomycetaceae bacterium]